MTIERQNDPRKDQLLNELKPVLVSFFYGMKQLVHQVKIEEPLAEGQVFLMHLLNKAGAIKVSDISERLGITAGAVTGMTDKLFNMGLVLRERSKEDRRVVWISLTEKGRDVVLKVQAQRFELVRKHLINLSEDDLKKSIETFVMLNSVLSPENNLE